MGVNLRKLARGQECQVRIYGVCNHNPDTVVLAHVRLAGITGAGQKAPDELAAWCCSSCQLITEQRKIDDYIQRSFLEGVVRTQYELIKGGYLGKN